MWLNISSTAAKSMPVISAVLAIVSANDRG